MVNINLLPDKIRSAESLKIIVLVGACSLALPVLFWSGRYQGARADLAQVDSELKELRLELESPQLKQIVAEVEQFTKDQGDLDAKRSVVDTLRKKQVTLLRFLDMLPDIMPKNAKITVLTVTDGKGGKEVSLTCDFLGLDSIAAVYESLEASPQIDRVEMATAPSSKKGNGRNTMTAAFKFVLVDQP